MKTYIDENWSPTNESLKELIDELKANEVEYNYDWIDGNGNKVSRINLGFGWEYECVEVFGGDEGDGEEYWIVFSIKRYDELIGYWKIEGYYASYDGTYLDGDLYKVVQREKLVLVWEKE